MRVIRNPYCGETQYILSTVEVSRGFSTSRVPTWRNLSLPAPRRHNSGSTVIPACRRQNARLFVHHLPFVAKRPTIAPHHHPIPSKTPVQTRPPRRHFHLALTLPPSVPYYPTPEFQPRHPGPRQPSQCPLPNTSILPPPNPLICPPIPLKPPPKPFTWPPFSPTTRPMPYWNERK